MALDWVALAIVIGFLVHEIINPRIIRSRNLIVFTLLFGLSLGKNFMYLAVYNIANEVCAILANLIIFLVRERSTETRNLTKDFAALPYPRAAATTAIILAVLSTIFGTVVSSFLPSRPCQSPSLAVAGFAASCVVQEIPQARLKISDPIPVRVWQPDTPTQFIELGSVQTGDPPPQQDEVAIRERWTDIPV